MPRGDPNGENSVLLDRVVHHGARVAVERYGKPVAALVSPEELELLGAIENRMDIKVAHRTRQFQALNRERRREQAALGVDMRVKSPVYVRR